MILPHEVVPWLLNGLNSTDLYDTIGTPQSVQQYWSHVEQTGMPWHPGLHPTTDLDKVIPVGLHGDDFRFTAAGQKLIAISLNFVLGERRGRYVLCVLRCVPCLHTYMYMHVMPMLSACCNSYAMHVHKPRL